MNHADMFCGLHHTKKKHTPITLETFSSVELLLCYANLCSQVLVLAILFSISQSERHGSAGKIKEEKEKRESKIALV